MNTNNAPRFQEPRDTDWWRVTFDYPCEGIHLIPTGFETDRFIDADEINLDVWTLTFSGEMLNGCEPEICSISAKRFDGHSYHIEPVKGALAALAEAYIVTRMHLLKQYIEEHGHFEYGHEEAA